MVAVDAKTMKRPLLMILDWELAPLAGVTPSGVETRDVMPWQLVTLAKQTLRRKISAALLGSGAVAPRLEAVEVKET